MDLDGDGHDDVLSGSYWPGDLFVFRGLGGTSYAAGETLKDRSGANLSAGGPWPDEDQPDLDALATAPFAADWDGDGDLDLLVGNFAGRVILIPNEGTARSPAFDGSRRRALEAGGSPIEVPDGDSGPVVADWDQDGVPDLVVGASDGSVRWFRNAGTAAVPVLEAGRTILEAEELPDEDPLEGTEPARPGVRAKVCVADYDGDGRLDLLVGDLAERREPERDLTPEQTARRDELRKEMEAASEAYDRRLRELESAKGRTEPELPDEEMRADPIVKELEERSDAIYEELQPLEPGYRSHGWVWLYRRK